MKQHPDYSIFPTLEKVKEGIHELKDFKWPTFDDIHDLNNYIRIVYKTFEKYFGVLPDIIYKHDKNTQLPFNFFRVRPLDTFSDTTMFCEYSYKPIHLTRETQRCNFPGNPVFYCSSDAGTALMEVIRNINTISNKTFLVSKWKVINPLNTKVIPYLYGDLPDKNYYKLFSEKAISEIPSIFDNNLNIDQHKGLRLYLNFLASIFTENNYSLSAALAHRIIYAKHNFRADMFLYPSIQTYKKSINIAIHPNFVDKNMILERIYSLQVKSVNSNREEFKIKVNKYATIEDSIISWKNLDPEDQLYRNYIREDFNFEGEFVYN